MKGWNMETKEATQTSKLSEFSAFPQMPQIDGGNGIFFDFNCGARVFIPKELKNVRVQIRNLSTGLLHINKLCNNIAGEEQDWQITTKIKYLVNWHIYIFNVETGAVVFNHRFNLYGHKISIQMPAKGALGDTIAWFAMIAQFALKNQNTDIYLLMNLDCHNLFNWHKYSNVLPCNKDEIEKAYEIYQIYATYRIEMYYGTETEDDIYNNPVDYRISGLAKIASNVLGMFDAELIKPTIAPVLEESRRTHGHKYVAIATKTTCHVKHWLNPDGWITVIDYLKNHGYNVYCIDRDDYSFGTAKGNQAHFSAFFTPPHCLDYTGAFSLSSRLNFIKNADLFIGLSSGLSWLAWLTETPVVMISNFTAAHNEFYTPYRVMNLTVCNSCWNDGRFKFINSDWFHCPRHRNDSHAHECQRLISSGMVIDKIKEALKLED